MSERRAHSQGTLMMIAVVLIWGSFLPVSKSALQIIDPYWLSVLRFGAAALAFLTLLVIREGWAALNPQGQFLRITLFGALGLGGFAISLFEGLRLTRPEITAMILAIGPVLTALFEWWSRKHRPDRITLIAIGFALIGELLVITAGDIGRLSGGDWLGNGLALLAALFWTGYTLGGRQFPGWSPVRYSALSCSAGWIALALATGVAGWFGHSQPPTLTRMTEVWPQLIYIMLVVSIVALLLWNMAVVRLGALSAGLFGNFTPVITYLIALVQGRRPDTVELFGAAVVLAALVANNLHQRSRSLKTVKLADDR